MQAQGMTEASKIEDLDTFCATLLPIFDRVEAKRWRKLFHGDRIIKTNPVRMRNKRSRAGRHSESSHLCYPNGRLTDNCGVQSPARRLDYSFELDFFLRAADVTALFPQLFENGVPYRLITDDRLLRRTQGPVIETLAGQDVTHGFRYVGSFFNVARNVSGSDTERRFTRAVGCSHKPCASSRQDQSRQSVLHQFLSAFHR